MATYRHIEKKMKTARELHSVVKTMKALAAVNIRHYEKAVESLKDYTRTMDLAFQGLLMSMELPRMDKDENEPVDLALIFGSDQGMCGQINESVAAYLKEKADDLEISKEDTAVIVCGIRPRAYVEDAGYEVDHQIEAPGSTDAITSSAQEIILLMDELANDRKIDKVILIYNRHKSQASFEPTHDILIPISQRYAKELKDRKWPSNAIPLITMDRRSLLKALTRQYLLSSLYRTFAQSLASENAARLASMQGAQKSIEERLSQLRSDFQRQRQMSITEELLDIISGFEALKEKQKDNI